MHELRPPKCHLEIRSVATKTQSICTAGYIGTNGAARHPDGGRVAREARKKIFVLKVGVRGVRLNLVE